MSKVANKKLNEKLRNLAQELNVMSAQELSPKRYKIRICTNQACLKNSENVIGYLKCKRKDVPICGFRNFCPDAHYRYFDYKVKFVREEK